ncbi:SEPSECS [Cordylochernes scorpioides]|uniref:O-phosphoseryl-tRNA(Sec) selenium transferase n=1 Tax=Cordylochernes scorpioides TaxID=51811 RepID=A0ABY6JW44_9ARAC|nr:SEPSECS [Cordylochernes scorpioides]
MAGCSGVPNMQACFILPLATGMSLTLCLLTLRRRNPKARYVLWPRIDQKSCLKCSLTAGFELVVVEPLREGDELHTNLPRLTELLQSMDPGSVACILSTTSCFAPRAPDDEVCCVSSVVAIAKLCKKADVPHIINNAYGLQCPVIMGNIAKVSAVLSMLFHPCLNWIFMQAARRGRVDAFIQSTDKNFMVPVGGAIVAGFDVEFISAIGKTYPGRGSACPSMDVLITLLSLGLEGYQKLLVSRKSMFIYLAEQLRDLAARYQERLLETPSNTISIGITLTADNAKSLTELGSMLFSRLVSGSRVVVPGGSKDVEGIQLEGWGSHCPNYPTAYLTAAAAIGITKKEIDQFISKFEKILHKFKEKHLKNMIALTPPEVEDSQQKLKVTPSSKWSNTPRGSWKKKDRRRKKSGETQPTDGDHQSPPESSVLNSPNSDPDQSIVNNSLDISTNGLPQQEI